MADTFGLDAFTKFHCTIRNFYEQIRNLGCFRRGSTDENEILHNFYKYGYFCRNSHTICIELQLFQSKTRYEDDMERLIFNE